MNRHDEIQALARDVATNIHADPVARDAMADDLIKLIAAMLSAQGKRVAGYGEAEGNDVAAWTFEIDTMSMDYSDEETAYKEAEFEREQREESAKFHGIYLAGEQMQTAARELEEACTNPRVDLERYGRPTGAEWCVCGHHPDSHKTNEHGSYCAGVLDNKRACVGGSCPEFRAKMPEPIWTRTDRRPERLRMLADPGTLVIPKVLEVEPCSKCTDAKPCANPDVGCLVVPPVRCCGRLGDHVCRSYTGNCCYSNDDVCPDHG